MYKSSVISRKARQEIRGAGRGTGGACFRVTALLFNSCMLLNRENFLNYESDTYVSTSKSNWGKRRITGKEEQLHFYRGKKMRQRN